MAHRATISADFPTNGRKVKILYHKGLFFAASRCLPHERTFHPGPSGPPNFDTTGVKIFFLWVDFEPLEIRNMWKQLPTQWVGTSVPMAQKLKHNFWPTGPQVESKIRAHWAQSENIFCWVFSFGPFRCLPIGKKNKKSFRPGLNFTPSKFGIFERKNFSQENQKKQAFPMPTTWEVLLTCTLTTE